MDDLNTIAVFGDKSLEGELRASLPGFRVHIVEPGKIRSLIRSRRIGLVASRFPRSHFNYAIYRGVARDSATYGIPAVFIAHSSKQAYDALHRSLSEPSVGIAYAPEDFRPVMNLLRERLRRHAFSEAVLPGQAASANLDGHPLIEQTTGFLRNKVTGRIDAKKVASLFDEPLKRFAGALGVSPSAVSQTPDSKKYQHLLGYFERAARIIPLLESKDMFAAWAKTPNKEMNGETPVDLLFGGPAKARRIVETVEDVLVGQPD